MNVNEELILANFRTQKEYLEKRGINLKTVSLLKLEFVTSTKLLDLGYNIPHIDKAILWRVAANTVGARLFYKQGRKGPKFATPPNQKSRLYFSPLADWNNYKSKQQIILCESYLKADILCMLGYNALGVCGVWGWSIEKRLNSDFEIIPWQDYDLEFIVSFDSNVGLGRKEELNLAVRRLSSEMERLGVDIKLAQLPPPSEDNDWGIDDFYMQHGKEEVAKLFSPDNLQHIEGDVIQHLRIMNSETAYVNGINRCVRLHYPLTAPITAVTFKTAAFANRIVWGYDKKGLPKKIRLAAEWLEWEDRKELDNIIYHPGKPRIYNNDFNVWNGMGCDPLEDEAWAELWVRWLELAFPNEQERHWFCCWWASQLQEIGIKMNTSLVMLGKSGVGKGWVAQIMRHIFGVANCASVSLTDLAGSFNSHYAQKQLIVVEEAEIPKNVHALHSKLKDIITNKKLSVNMKGVPAYEIDNHINLCLQSNNIDVLKLEGFDRRFAVFDIVSDELAEGGDDFWALRMEGLKAGLPEAIYAWLLDYELGNFDPFDIAMNTEAKETMFRVGLSGREEFVDSLKDHADKILPDKACLYTAGQLEFIYQGMDVNVNQVRTMAKVLAHMRFKQVCDRKGKPAVLRGRDGKCQRWWIIRDLPSSDYQDFMSEINLLSIK